MSCWLSCSSHEDGEAAPAAEQLAAILWYGGLQQAVQLQTGECQAQTRIN